MSHQPPLRAMKCSRCGKLFNGNPRTQPVGRDNYCSIGCEEGRTPRPMEDPQSPDYHRYLQGEPEALVGEPLVAFGLSLVNYTPDWCKGPEDWSSGVVTWVDEEAELYVRKDHIHLGKVVEYDDGSYKIRYTKPNGELSHFRWHTASTVISQIRNDRWYVA